MPTYNMNLNGPALGVGLGTWIYPTITVAGPYAVNLFINFISPTGLVVTINKNGSPIAPTPSSMAPSQTMFGLEAFVDCAIGDIISVVLSDSTVNDLSIPTIKSIINIYPGG